MRILIFLLFTILFAQSVEAQTKRALIIAIGDYAQIGDYDHIDEHSGAWSKINSNNDIPLIKGALERQNFSSENIAMLKNEQATKEGILAALDRLISETQKGDIIVFHYSGHGQQIYDDNNDEVDGFDESIVPYDAATLYIEGVYEGERHLRDDDIGAKFKELRQKLGEKGHLLVVMDACHSGTATRGIASARGSEDQLKPEGFNTSASSDQVEEDMIGGSLDQKKLSPFVLISGSSASELNYETFDENNKRVGSLSYAFSKTMAKAEGKLSYAGLFDRIRAEMSSLAPRQTPQIEGDIENYVLSGEVREAVKYYRIKKFLDDKNAIVEGGMLMGLLEGSEVALYPIDQDTAGVEPLARGRVVAAYDVESDIHWEQSLSKEEVLNTWVYVTKENFGAMQVNLQVAIEDNSAFKKLLLDKVNQVGLINVVENSPELVLEMNNAFTSSRGANALQVITADEFKVYEGSLSSGEEEKMADLLIEEVIIPYAQANFLRKLEVPNSRMEVKLSVIPVAIEQVGRRYSISDTLNVEDFMSNGIMEMKEGQVFMLAVENKSNKDLFVNVLDITPDNKVGLLLPNAQRTVDEYRIMAGETKYFGDDLFQVVPPYGLDNVKIIATEQPINLSSIVSSKGASSRGVGSTNPFEALLGESYKSDSSSRGSASVSIPPSAGSISTVIYRIVE